MLLGDGYYFPGDSLMVAVSLLGYLGGSQLVAMSLLCYSKWFPACCHVIILLFQVVPSLLLGCYGIPGGSKLVVRLLWYSRWFPACCYVKLYYMEYKTTASVPSARFISLLPTNVLHRAIQVHKT